MLLECFIAASYREQLHTFTRAKNITSRALRISQVLFGCVERIQGDSGYDIGRLMHAEDERVPCAARTAVKDPGEHMACMDECHRHMCDQVKQ
jgi:hypothetical protein